MTKQPVSPSPQDFFNPNKYVVQPTYPAPQQIQSTQQQTQSSTSKYDPIAIILGLLSTPVVADLVRSLLNRQSNTSNENDPIRDMAIKQMIDSWKELHERARRSLQLQEELMKQMMTAFALNNTKSYAKGLEVYYKDIAKVRAQKDAENILKEEEEVEQPPQEEQINPIILLLKRLDDIDQKLDKLSKKSKEESAETQQSSETSSQQEDINTTSSTTDDGEFVQ